MLRATFNNQRTTMKLSRFYAAAALAAAHLLHGCAAESSDSTHSEAELGAIDEQPAVEVSGTSAALIDAQLCSIIEATGNDPVQNQKMLDQVRGFMVGRTETAGLRDGKELRITSVEWVSFTGCKIKIRMGVKLRRPGIRQDGIGFANISGTLVAARMNYLFTDVGWRQVDRACLDNVKTDSLDLSHTLNVTENLFEWVSNKRNNDQCFNPGSMWTDLENAIAFVRALGGTIPSLTYEMLPNGMASDVIHGAILDRYNAKGGKNFFGTVLDAELPTFDGVGRKQPFQNGDISWHPSVGAFSTIGAIRDKWRLLGREAWGYPTTDENVTPDGVGRYNHFVIVNQEARSIYWTPQTGAVSIRGDIRVRWAQLGWERSSLGYPISDEGPLPNGEYGQRFQRGTIVWSPSTGPVVR